MTMRRLVLGTAAAAFATAASGHFGGAMVHEPEYLTEHAPAALKPALLIGLGTPAGEPAPGGEAAPVAVVVEKPMCITVDEATAMIEAGRATGKMVSIFHNRRQDADYRALREIVVEKQLLGDVFSVEMWGGGFGAPNW